MLAATERAGVAVTNPRQQNGIWRTPTRDCGLPLRESGTFQALTSVGADDAQPPLALCGGSDGVYRSADGRTWTLASPAEFSDQVSLPPNWLFAPGEHQITVRYDDARLTGSPSCCPRSTVGLPSTAPRSRRSCR